MSSWWLKKVLRLRRDAHLFMTHASSVPTLSGGIPGFGGTGVTMMDKVFTSMECSYQGVC